MEQQADSVTHKARQLLIKQRTMAMNSLRSLMAEFGIIAPQGPQHIGKLLAILADPEDTRVPAVARTALNTMSEMLSVLEKQVEALDKDIKVRIRGNATARRLDTIPGFGPILSSAIAAIVTNPRHFDSGRDFAASLGLVPRQDGTRRQNQTWPHQQAWQRISTPPAGERSDRGAQRKECQERSVAGQAARQQAEKAGRGRPGQQDGAHRLGGDDATRGLPASCRGGLKGRRARERKTCEGENA